MKHVLFALAAVASLGFGGSANADDLYFSYKDWNVTVESIDTGEDLRISCRMSTGGDGDPVVVIDISNGDGLPPYDYPGVMFTSQAPRGYSTGIDDGETITFVFDDGDQIAATAYKSVVDGAYEYAETSFPLADKQRVLQAMQRNSTVDIISKQQVMYTASLSGFTAAYRKIAEQCGFPVTGVID